MKQESRDSEASGGGLTQEAVPPPDVLRPLSRLQDAQPPVQAPAAHLVDSSQRKQESKIAGRRGPTIPLIYPKTWNISLGLRASFDTLEKNGCASLLPGLGQNLRQRGEGLAYSCHPRRYYGWLLSSCSAQPLQSDLLPLKRPWLLFLALCSWLWEGQMNIPAL